MYVGRLSKSKMFRGPVFPVGSSVDVYGDGLRAMVNHFTSQDPWISKTSAFQQLRYHVAGVRESICATDAASHSGAGSVFG